MANFTWSPQNDAIFRFVVEEDGNLVAVARAGTGKTTTIVEAVKRLLAARPGLSVVVCAFSKDIQLELERRFVGTTGVTVKTLHALGLAAVKRFWPDVKVGFSSDRENDLAQRVCGSVAPDTIKKLVAQLCTKGRLTTPHATSGADLVDVALRFELEPDDDWADEFGLDYVCARAYDAMVLAASEKPVRTGIDGADMIFLPVRNGWLRKAFDAVVVDEAQDMNACQLEIAEGICRGRILVFGDDMQAIFGFAGADSGSLMRLKAKFSATELPLTITYRCGRAIVDVARAWVSDFSAGFNNPEGLVSVLDQTKLTGAAGPGDFVLSRVNAPLVSIAMSLLRSGKRTKIAGRDIGKGLVALVRKMKARSVPDLLNRIAVWEKREASRLAARYAGKMDSPAYQARLDGIHDQAEMLASLTDGAPSVGEVENRIEALFTDDGLGQAGVITCSSVHKAKGLEANRVFILKDTLRKTTQEEQNICYVAVTRAKNELVWVTGGGR